jgi:predicted nucleic acid-binding protein
MDKGRTLRLRPNDLKIALDTNILVYIEGVNGPARRHSASEFVAKLTRENVFVPVQALGELFRVLIRKAKYPPERARTAVLSSCDVFRTIETSPSILLTAIDLSTEHDLDIWDAIILAAAASVGCRLLLSEDLQDGFTWNGVTVANPFAAMKNPLLATLLKTE